jgi:hypothetical protein
MTRRSWSRSSRTERAKSGWSLPLTSIRYRCGLRQGSWRRLRTGVAVVSTDSLDLKQLLCQLGLRGITFARSGAKLVVDDPVGRLTPSLDRAIREHRGALMKAVGTLQMQQGDLLFDQDGQPAIVPRGSTEAERPAAVLSVISVFDGAILDEPIEGIDIPVSKFLAAEAEPSKCHACCQRHWWTQSGRRICAVCHPPRSGRGTEAKEIRGRFDGSHRTMLMHNRNTI